MGFLPKDFKVSSTKGNYAKFEEGENRFRVLGDAITGFEFWSGDENGRKPTRVQTMEEVPAENKTPDAFEDGNYPKDFMMFPIFNRKLKVVQVLEVTQKKIMRAIAALYKSEDWGAPQDYDVIVTKEKTGSDPKNVSYSVMPCPKKPLEESVVKLYDDAHINLEKIWTNENPFGGEDIILTKEQEAKIK